MAHLYQGVLIQAKSSVFHSVQIARQCFQHCTWNVLPRVTTSWGLNTLRFNIISKLFDSTTSQPNCSFLCWNCQIVSPTWAIMRNLARLTWSKHLNVKLVSKSKLRPTQQRISSFILGNTRWVKTVTLATVSCCHNELTLDSPLLRKAWSCHEPNRHWSN